MSSETEGALNSGAESRSAAPPPDSRRRLPVTGLLVASACALGVAGWTATRLQAATQAKAALAEQRTLDHQQKSAQAALPARVRWTQGKPEEWTPVVHLEGTLSAIQSADLGFKQGGRIASVLVKVGDQVKAGALLATLDASEAKAQLSAASAQARAAEAQLELVSDAQRRTEQLVRTGSIAEARGVESTQQKALAQAQLEATRAQVGLLKVSLGNHALVAPFAGTITRTPDGIGAVVGAGTVLFSLADLRKLKLRATVSEADGGLLSVGAPIELEREQSAIRGQLSAVIGVMDPATRRVPVEAVFDHESVDTLRAGSFVRATVAGQRPIPVLRLPHEVLRPGSQDEVFAIENGVLSSRHVAFTVDRDGTLLVRTGVTTAERIVLGPKAEARAGDRVQTEDGSALP